MSLRLSRRAVIITVLAVLASFGLGAVAVAATRGIALTPSVTSVTLLPGTGKTVKVSVAGTGGYTGPVTLSFAVAKPAGVSVALNSSSSTTGSYRYLTIKTSSSTLASKFTVTIKGVSGSFVAYTSVALTVSQTGLPLKLALAGAVTVPGPGQSVPVDVRITNPNSLPVRVVRLALAVTAVTKASTAAAGMPCGTEDFTTTRYVGPTTAAIPAGGTVLLSSLVPDRTVWPRLTMVNAATNQDGCRGAKLTLSLTGGGAG